jgi:hypothetical protein
MGELHAAKGHRQAKIGQWERNYASLEPFQCSFQIYLRIADWCH